MERKVGSKNTKEKILINSDLGDRKEDKELGVHNMNSKGIKTRSTKMQNL